jgi:hypothetical protein
VDASIELLERELDRAQRFLMEAPSGARGEGIDRNDVEGGLRNIDEIRAYLARVSKDFLRPEAQEYAREQAQVLQQCLSTLAGRALVTALIEWSIAFRDQTVLAHRGSQKIP